MAAFSILGEGIRRIEKFPGMVEAEGARAQDFGKFRVWLYRGYIGIMEKKMETTIMGYIGFKGFRV